MALKVALLGIYHESNTFVTEPTTLGDFDRGHYMHGEAILREYRDAHHEIGGMLEVMEREGVEVVPVTFAEATPGGTVTAEAMRSITSRMLDGLKAALPVDACLVVPHGAGVAEGCRDLDGYWLAEVRQIVGPEIPVIGTLDLHANVSHLMAESTDALVAYRKNPHTDQRERGIEAAGLLLRWLRREVRPVQVLTQVPLAISIEQQLTANEPCRSLYQYADELRKAEKVLSLSILHGFPYADVEEMGTSIIVVTDNDRRLADRIGEQLSDHILAHRDHFVGPKISIASAVSQVKDASKPVLLLDMGDNVGGGGPANNICLVDALEQRSDVRYFACICDPQAVADCRERQTGESFPLLVHGTGREGAKDISLNVKLLRMSDGNFSETNPRHGGQVNFKMGLTAIVATENGSVLMLTSLRVLPFSLQQLLSCGIDPADFDAIVAKGVNAPVAAYAPVCPTIIQVNTPGVTQADMTLFEYIHRRKPLYPFEV